MSSILTFPNRSVKLFTLRKSLSDNSESSAFYKNLWLMRKWNNVSASKAHKDFCSKSLSQIGGFTYIEVLVKELQPLVSHTLQSNEDALLWCGGGILPIAKSGKSKLNLTISHSILQHHAIPSGTWLVTRGFVLMQGNDPQATSKVC